MATTNKTSKRKQGVDPFAAMESLRAALDDHGIVLPSLWIDSASPDLRLIELGRIHADVAMRLAQALQQGGPQT